MISLHVLDQPGWTNWLATVSAEFADGLTNELAEPNPPGANPGAFEKLKLEMSEKNNALAFFAPRGVGLDFWSGGDKRLTQIRRRFMLLGQTLDGMRVWDIRRAIQAIHFVQGGSPAKIELRANDGMAADTLYAALFEPTARALDLVSLPKSHMEGPDYLGVLKVTDIPQVKDAVAAHAELKLETQ